MKEILRLEMAIKKNDDGANIKFRCGINKIIEEVLNDEESEKINDLIGEINQVIVGAMKRDIADRAINETIKELIGRTPEEMVDRIKNETNLYEKLSDEDKKRADKFDKELEKCESFEEAILLALREIKDVLN